MAHDPKRAALVDEYGRLVQQLKYAHAKEKPGLQQRIMSLEAANPTLKEEYQQYLGSFNTRKV